MRIVVLVKQVPNTTEVKLDPKTGNLIREGIESIINPEDRHGVEAALQIKEKTGGSVTVISMGPPQAVDAICECLAMGADRGILLTDKAFAGADTWATSTVLGRAVQKLEEYDMVIAGRQAIDGDTAQIGPQVAEYLNIPQLTYVSALEAEEGKVVAERTIEEGCERIEAPLPVLITVLAGLNEPRFPTVAGLLDAAAGRSPIEYWNAADLGFTVHEIGLEGSLTHVIRTFTPKEARDTRYLEGAPSAVADELFEALRQKEIRLGE